MSAFQAVETFRPQLRNLLPNYTAASRVARPLIAVGLIAAATSLAITSNDSLRGVAAVAALCLVAALPVPAYVWRTRLAVGPASMTYRRLLGRPIEIPRERLSRIALRSIAHRKLLPGDLRDVPNRKAFLVGHDGHSVLNLVGWLWLASDFQRIAALLGIACDDEWLDADAAALRKEIPGSVNWFEVNTTAAILGVVLALMALGILAASVYSAVH